MDRSTFEKQWRESGEATSKIVLETAWRRYKQMPSPTPEYTDPTLQELEANFLPALEAVKSTSSTYRTFHLPGNRPPWKATGMTIAQGQSVTILATGRLWRSKLLDLWLGPQFGLWYRIGQNGQVFNSTESTITFISDTTAELYLGTQFPGQFGDRSGRVLNNLRSYDNIEGSFEVVVIAWKHDAKETLEAIVNTGGDPFHLASRELSRNDRALAARLPSDWHFLWFLGVSNIFTAVSLDDGAARAFHCLTQGNVGIIQKDIMCPLRTDTALSWNWLVSSLPSRLREDTTLSHDYLSVAVEFENGRDLTYTWSCGELPVGFGYWCPLATWCDREFHIVIRSGESQLGKWLEEQRNVSDDYRKYIGEEAVPERIVRVWLIAGSRWQRINGEMTVKGIRILSSKGRIDVL